MIVYNDQVISPGKFRVPQYNISPFSTEFISKNFRLLQSKNGPDLELLSSRFGNYLFCESGKSAIYQVLNQYNLSEGDEVYIVTTTGNKYISGCVTREIEKFCKWSRELTEHTKLIYVNHEFGVVYDGMSDIVKLGIPVVEDMAMSMFSSDIDKATGKYGDFTVYSLPKFFPIQYGGVIQINNADAVRTPFTVNRLIAENLGKLASYYLKDSDSIRLSRLKNHQFFSQKIASLGFRDRFVFKENEVPSVYMFSTGPDVNLNALKAFTQENGVEASVFYGESAFFIPVHQYLDEIDIDFIVSLIEFFLQEVDSLNRVDVNYFFK